jgi:serine protease AprX
VITVGAAGTGDTADPSDDTPAPWSSYGYTGDGFAKPELVAPGRMLVGPVPGDSVLAQSLPDRVVAPGWMWMSGTSFAAPIVSGIAARLVALHPGWTPGQVKGALMKTATPVAGGLQSGVGEVNGAAAAALADPPSANAALDGFVHAGATGEPAFDGDAWMAAVADASWASASWASASWASASWASASWASASWASASWASASWASASWASASWASASWASASWAS